jgi:uncharacterized protein (UPF0276 family)
MHSPYFPELGFGLGLRPPHYAYIFEHQPKVDWFEIISENFMDTDGRPKRNLARVREQYPVVMHGVALSIGTVDPLNSEYLAKLKELIDFVKPAWVSDHLCWTGIAHRNSHDLLPLPYTEEALNHVVARIKQVQDFLEQPIALENPSTYLEFKTSHMDEAEFIARMVKESGCQLLLDVNNVYVSCYNHRLDPKAYIDALPLDQVVQVHLSGHLNKGTHIIDTHDDVVVDAVWELYKYVTNRAGRTLNTMIEWDDKLPPFEALYAELEKAKRAARDAERYYTTISDFTYQKTQHTPHNVTLGEVQTWMQEAILQGSQFNSQQPDQWIRAKHQFTATEQLEVYTNAYRWRLVDTTAEDYPVLQQYLGTESFDALIDNFVDHTYSTHFNIGRYAAKLPQFLAQRANADAFSIELAILENAVSQLTDPAETQALTSDHFVGMTTDALMESMLRPRTALQLFAFNYPVNSYYLAVKEGRFPEPPRAEKSFVVVFRHEDTVWRMDLERDEFYLLQTLFAGVPIGKALETVQQEFEIPSDTLTAQLSHWFARWMRNGLLAAN